MIVRNAEQADLNRCLALDGSYETEYVWQMQIEEAGAAVQSVSFRTVRLPRPMRVAYPRQPESLLESWERRNRLLVAEEGSLVQGYLDLEIHPWNRTGWINSVVVAKELRRQGLGSALLKAAQRWAEEKRLRQIVLETQTKNHPAISFFQKHGFVFCGYHDRYYANQDIALFFAQELRG
ncbi:MAG: GNAT family N-acetyltransferase [Chloroflexi bacterium]|nr:GNAT family N-acetyltransferase [Chloroflexota bacterium]